MKGRVFVLHFFPLGICIVSSVPITVSYNFESISFTFGFRCAGQIDPTNGLTDDVLQRYSLHLFACWKVSKHMSKQKQQILASHIMWLWGVRPTIWTPIQICLVLVVELREYINENMDGDVNHRVQVGWMKVWYIRGKHLLSLKESFIAQP
jgi:hypothetical protein